MARDRVSAMGAPTSSDLPARVNTPARPRLRRRPLFIAISVALPLVLLLAIEGGLRLFGFGGYPDTFRRVGKLADGSTLIITDNPGPASYFFANKSRPGTLRQECLVMPKPAGVFRIVLAGESAAKGFPQPKALSAASFLKTMLQDLVPDKSIEVINLGTTAVASFPVLGMVTESLDYSPDLVIVYVGNNEFFGAYGVASLHSAGRSPAVIKALRAFRWTAVAQFIDAKLRPAAASGDKTLMETMIGQSFIASDDPARAAAARTLREFVGAMVDRCRAKGVPVVVCTPPFNERDLAPLGEPEITTRSLEESTRVKSLIAAGAAMLKANDHAGAANNAREVLKSWPHHANAWFLLGQARSAIGDESGAAKAFQSAENCDTMPWRPPSPSVEAVREAAANHGAVLCDLIAAFRGASGGGGIGWELMDDHVHPSLRGQDLAARTIARTLAEHKLVPGLELSELDAMPDWNAFAARLGANPYEAYGVAHTVRILFDIPFFRATNPEGFPRFDAVCKELDSRVTPEVREALRDWQKPETHLGGEQRPISGMVGKRLIAARNPAEAEPLFRVAAESVPQYSSWSAEFTYYMLACRLALRPVNGQVLDDAEKQIALAAVGRCEVLLSQGRSPSGQAERYAGRLCQLRGEHEKAIPFLLTAREKLFETDRVANDQALVEAYVATGQPEKARAVVEKGIEQSGKYADMYRRMRGLIRP